LLIKKALIITQTTFINLTHFILILSHRKIRKHRLQVYRDENCAVSTFMTDCIRFNVLYYSFRLFIRIAMEYTDFDHVSDSYFSITQLMYDFFQIVVYSDGYSSVKQPTR
jgi:hypothetical protein